MRYIRIKHRHNGKGMFEMRRGGMRKWVTSEEGMPAFENIKSLGRREIAEGRGESPIYRAIKIFVELVKKTELYN